MDNRTFGDRFWEKVDTSGGPNACWPWIAFVAPNGYGQMTYRGRKLLAHRAAYEYLVEPIPEGEQIDHKCHDPETCAGGPTCPHRRCCNPTHLAPETQQVNVRRAHNAKAHHTHCPKGHEFTPDNIRLTKEGWRVCITCKRQWDRDYRERTKRAT